MTRSFGVFCDLHLNKRLSKQSRPGDLWRHRAHYGDTVMIVWTHKTRPKSRANVRAMGSFCEDLGEIRSHYIGTVLYVKYRVTFDCVISILYRDIHRQLGFIVRPSVRSSSVEIKHEFNTNHYELWVQIEMFDKLTVLGDIFSKIIILPNDKIRRRQSQNISHSTRDR